MHHPSIDELSEASETLARLSELASDFHPEHRLWSEAAQMKLFIAAAQTYVQAYALELAAGKDPQDALIAAVEGATQLPAKAVDAFDQVRRRGLQ